MNPGVIKLRGSSLCHLQNVGEMGSWLIPDTALSPFLALQVSSSSRGRAGSS